MIGQALVLQADQRSVLRPVGSSNFSPNCDISSVEGCLHLEAHIMLANLFHDHFASPQSSAVLSGQVRITGAAEGNKLDYPANFPYYKVEVGAGTNPTAWTVLALSTQPVGNGKLASWDTTKWANGTYTLRLMTVDESGNYSPWEEITVQVHN